MYLIAFSSPLPTLAGPTCMSEMTAVMSCWKVNTFDDVLCTSEIKRFLECVEKAVSRPMFSWFKASCTLNTYIHVIIALESVPFLFRYLPQAYSLHMMLCMQHAKYVM